MPRIRLDQGNPGFLGHTPQKFNTPILKNDGLEDISSSYENMAIWGYVKFLRTIPEPLREEYDFQMASMFPATGGL